MRIRAVKILFFCVIGVLCFFSCKEKVYNELLDKAEVMLETAPDTAITVLSQIDKNSLRTDKDMARYSLLMSIALDKNFIDTTNFTVMQPAIDYYLKKGTPREKLQTYYYQGRIYQNCKDNDNAMKSFMRGLDYGNIAPIDSMTLARLYNALSLIVKASYDYTTAAEYQLRAANIVAQKQLYEMQAYCLLNALDCSLLSDNQQRADSIFRVCESLFSSGYLSFDAYYPYKLSYFEKFKSTDELKKLLDQHVELSVMTPDIIMTLADCYHELKDNNSAFKIISQLNDTEADAEQGESPAKFTSIKYMILYDKGDYKEACKYLVMYHDYLFENYKKMYDNKLRLIEQRHADELDMQKHNKEKNIIILGFLGGIIVLIAGICILLLVIRNIRIKRQLAIQKEKNVSLENEKLKVDRDNLNLENDKLQLENINLTLERDKKNLETENLRLRIRELEVEREKLSELLNSKTELPEEVRETLKTRIEMLNSLLASQITYNDDYEKPYEEWVKSLTSNVSLFMDSNRLSFTASHPDFISFLEMHDLTIDEINYVCLYALGLRGKEVGNYMRKRSHVNTSSIIRKKLGLDKHDTNLGNYIRKLLRKL